MKSAVFYLLMVFTGSVFAQSKATENLQKQYPDAFSLFFYQNTLRMINQSEDKAFDEMIKDIEKMKFLLIDKGTTFTPADYKKITQGYTAESFENVMNSRYQGRNFDVLMKEKGGKTAGMIILVNDSTNLFVLDVVGSISLNQVTTLYNTLDKSTDIGNRIKSFTDRNAKRKEDDKE